MIRLLVVDDSPLIRRLFTELFEAEGDFEVAVARGGEEALEMLSGFAPDVITLDVQMPGLDGLACLDRIMLQRPTPVVMVSSLTAAGADETVAALQLGAVDALAKPSGALSLRMDELGPRLVEVVRGAAEARIPRVRRLAERVRAMRAERPVVVPAPAAPKPAKRPADTLPGLVVVGASTGGPPVLDALLGELPPDFPWPIVIAQHMPSTFTGALARRLDNLTPLDVVEVVRPLILAPGTVYVGRGDADVVVTRRTTGLVVLAAPADGRFRWHPSVDRLTESAMAHLPAAQLVGVLLTGMGDDGAAAMARLHGQGGRTIAESEESAVVWGMPGELVRARAATVVAHAEVVGRALVEMVAA